VGLNIIPKDIRDNWKVHEWRHACAVLKHDYPNELKDMIDVLRGFKLYHTEIKKKGGNKSLIAKRIDAAFSKRDWEEKSFDTKFMIDGKALDSPTHSIDCFKNEVGLEIEWNNKDPFFDRDLNNFRLLFDLRVLSVGVIITRTDELQSLLSTIRKGSSYGKNTTHWGKLLPRINGGGGGGCPLLVFGIKKELYVNDSKAKVASGPAAS